jgi:hypothetical protein
VSPDWDLEDTSASTRSPGVAVAGRPDGRRGDAGEPTAAGSISFRLLYGLAALFVFGATLASLNPRFGFFQKENNFDAHFWPWEAFAGPDGVHLDWLPPHAFVVSMVLAGFGLLFCAFLPAGRLRACLALGAFVAIGVAVMPGPGSFMTLAGVEVGLALLLGSWLACREPDAHPAALRLMLTAWVALLIFAFFPYPTEVEEGADRLAPAPYASAVTEPVRSLLRTLEDPPPMIERPGEARRPVHLGDWARANVLNLTFLLSLLVGLYGLLRKGRSSARWLLALLVLAHLIGPAIEHALRALADFRASTDTNLDLSAYATDTVLRNLAQVLLSGLRLTLLPLALGLGDLLRGPPAPRPAA